jgi:ubiquinone/menaquinone biosynthesis C-methylase UbiE
MSVLHQALSPLDGGRVLDVATGQGGFVHALTETLKSYTKIIGIDTDAQALETARSRFDQARVRFMYMDAERMDYPDASFGTVTISASLHHLANPPRVLAEMFRVLEPGGHLVVAEMHRDGRTEAQLTAVRIHHWAAQVDTALDVVHHKTFARQELIDGVQALGVQNLVQHDFFDMDSDPMDAKFVEQVDGYIERFLQRAEGLPSYPTIEKQAQELRRQVSQGGIQREPVLVLVGQKPS